MNLSLCYRQDFGSASPPPSHLPPELGLAQCMGKDPFTNEARSSCLGHGGKGGGGQRERVPAPPVLFARLSQVCNSCTGGAQVSFLSGE